MPGTSKSDVMILRATGDRRLGLQCAVLVAGLTISGIADACTLDALLRLPLEQLLELKVGQPGCSPGQPTAGPLQPQSVPGSLP